MAKCAVQSCTNKSDKDSPEGVTFHPFPKDPRMRQVWIDATGNGSDWTPDKHQVCSEHFKDNCFQQLKKSRRLFVFAIPTLKLESLQPKVIKKAARPPREAVPEEPDGETPELNEEMKKRKRLDEIFVKPLCSRCKKRVAHITSYQLEGQAKSIVSKVYQFIQEEFKDIKDRYGDAIDLTPLSHFRKRTAYACGVSYRTVGLVLKEEQAWKEARGSPVPEPPAKRQKAMPEQTDGESPIESSSEEITTEESNFETEQNSTEIDERETTEKETSSDGTQEEMMDQRILDVNQNYNDNADIIESVSIEFEFRDMEANSNSNQSSDQQVDEPTTSSIMNQDIQEQQNEPIQEMNNFEPIRQLGIKNQTPIELDQPILESTIIAVVDPNQSADMNERVNQVMNSLNSGMEPTLIMVDSMANQSDLLPPGQGLLDQAMIEPGKISMLDPVLHPEMEQPQIFEPRFDMDRGIITVMGDISAIENPCNTIPCEEEVTSTMISDPQDPQPELDTEDVQDESQLNSRGEASNDSVTDQYDQQNDSDGNQYTQQNDSDGDQYNSQSESQQNDAVGQQYSPQNDSVDDQYNAQNASEDDQYNPQNVSVDDQYNPQNASDGDQYNPQTVSENVQYNPQNASDGDQYNPQTVSENVQYNPQNISVDDQYNPLNISVDDQYNLQTVSVVGQYIQPDNSNNQFIEENDPENNEFGQQNVTADGLFTEQNAVIVNQFDDQNNVAQFIQQNEPTVCLFSPQHVSLDGQFIQQNVLIDSQISEQNLGQFSQENDPTGCLITLQSDPIGQFSQPSGSIGQFGQPSGSMGQFRQIDAVESDHGAYTICRQSPESTTVDNNGQMELLERVMMPPPDFVDSACQTDRDTDTPLQVAAAAEYCEESPVIDAIGLVQPIAHLEAQAIVAEPQFFTGADGENLNVQRIECGDGYGYFVILN